MDCLISEHKFNLMSLCIALLCMSGYRFRGIFSHYIVDDYYKVVLSLSNLKFGMYNSQTEVTLFFGLFYMRWSFQ